MNSGCLANSSRGGQQHVMQQNKNWIPQLWVKVSFSLNVQDIVNGISYKLMALFTENKGGFDQASGVSEKILSSCPL